MILYISGVEMGMTARLGLKPAQRRIRRSAQQVEMGMTARLGLKPGTRATLAADQ